MRTRYAYNASRSAGRTLVGAVVLVALALLLRFTTAQSSGDNLPLPTKLALMHELPGVILSSEDIPVFSPPDVQIRQPQFDAPAAENTLTLAQPPIIEPETEELPVKVINITPVSMSGYLVAADNVLVKNSSGVDVDVKYLLGRGLPYSLNDKGAQVLILHTHGSESYTEPGKDTYDPATESNRSQDTEVNIVRVGAEIAKIVEQAGFGVIHDKTMYDVADFNTSYEAALEGIKQHLKKNPSIKIIIDVHRDSMITAEGVKYKPLAVESGENCAQVMLVMGTGANGLSHEYWKENLKLALRLQRRMNTDYPGIARPIDLRKERFNQHATMGSMIVEIGSSGNTLEEALAGARCFANSLVAELNKIKK